MNPQEEKERAIWRQQKHMEIKQELRGNEKFMKFLEKTYPFAREQFIDEYAGKKVNWLDWGPSHIKWMEEEDIQWLNDAAERLKEIQQKKLFDTQCLWRAEKIIIPQIKLTYDFKYWEDNILNCPFIPPVTEEEVALYIQYLQSENFENEQGFLERWQDYEEIKQAYTDGNANRNFPDWYDFHNSRTGLSVYLLFPDVRGGKEKFYISLWKEENKKKLEQQTPAAAPDPNTDTRPHLDFFKKGWMTWFVNTFEDKETQEYFKRYGGERAFDDYDEILADDLSLLEMADRIMPIQGWFDWREAIHNTAGRFRREKIMEALPAEYQTYRMHVDANFPFEEPKPIFNLQDDWYHKAILRGRELNGEPRNFDF